MLPAQYYQKLKLVELRFTVQQRKAQQLYPN